VPEPYGVLGATVPESDDYESGGADVPKAFREFSDSLGAGQGSGKILIVQNTGAAAWKAMSGDVSINSSGVTQIGNSKLATGMYQDASVTDGKLFSPSNSVYRTLLTSKGLLYNQGGLGGVYLLGSATAFGGALFGSGVALTPKEASNTELGPDVFDFDDADYAVAGKTQKLRLRAQVLVNGTKPTQTLTFGLYPVTVGGGEHELALSAGAVVGGSTLAFAEPPASTVTRKVTTDFAAPPDGEYLIGVVLSATLTAKSVVQVAAQLQHHNV
jgi:hypothetical protein